MTDPLEHAETNNCANCGGLLGEPHAFCGNCNERYCLACASTHFCTPTCHANGCFAGLCTRLIRNGGLSRQWGVPKELIAPAD
jgi:hypothetical protein